MDGISLFLVLLTGLLFPLAMIGPKVHDNLKAYMAWMLILEAACMGSFLSLDLFVFFFLLRSSPSSRCTFIIAGWGYANRGYASTKFFLFTLTGSAVMLVGMLALVVLHAKANGGTLTFDLVALTQGHPHQLAIRN